MPERLRQYFYLSQLVIGALFILGAWLMFRSRGTQSQFRVREADLRPKPGKGSGESLGEARVKPAAKPLSLPGVRLEGTPFQILGISGTAGEDEINRAYRDLMKRYHPDRVRAPAGSQAWKDAQKVAEVINRAREEALKRVGKV